MSLWFLTAVILQVLWHYKNWTWSTSWSVVCEKVRWMKNNPSVSDPLFSSAYTDTVLLFFPPWEPRGHVYSLPSNCSVSIPMQNIMYSLLDTRKKKKGQLNMNMRNLRRRRNTRRGFWAVLIGEEVNRVMGVWLSVRGSRSTALNEGWTMEEKRQRRSLFCSEREKLSVKNLSYLGETLSFCLTLFAAFALDNGEVTTEWCPTHGTHRERKNMDLWA